MFQKPELKEIENQAIKLVPLEASHARQLFEAASTDKTGIFYHMFFGPFQSEKEILGFIQQTISNPEQLTFSVFSKRLTSYVGTCSILNIDIEFGSAELGSIWYSNSAQGTEVNPNTIFMLLCYLFDELKYRRVVWKCDDTNVRSKEAAIKLGFEFEGVFRKHMIIKGRNRDTAWFSIIDEDWSKTKDMLTQRLDKKNEMFK